MGKFLAILFSLLLLIVVGGGAFLATWDIPAPSALVEKTVPNDRLKN